MKLFKSIEHLFKMLILGFIGISGKGDRFVSSLKGDRIKKILFIRPQKIGDIFIAFPVFDALKRVGYDGWMTAEVIDFSGGKPDKDRAAKVCKELARLITEYGGGHCTRD